MEDTGLGINELLDNSGELHAITGLHQSDLMGEDDYSDDSDDEIAEYLNYLETNDIEESDHESGPPSPVNASTPMKGTQTPNMFSGDQGGDQGNIHLCCGNNNNNNNNQYYICNK